MDPWINNDLIGKSLSEEEGVNMDFSGSFDESYKASNENNNNAVNFNDVNNDDDNDDNDNDNNDDAAVEDHPPRVKFDVIEPSSADAGAGAHNLLTNSAGGVVMDSMAYLTQPDVMMDNSSSHDEDDDVNNALPVDNNNNNNSNNNNNNNNNDDDEESQNQHYQDMHHTPPPSSSQQFNKKGRRGTGGGGGGGRARKQSGDFLSQLGASPEGRQHSSTARKSGSATLDTTPIAESPAKRNNSELDTTPIVESPLRSPSPLLMSQFMKPSPAVSALVGGNRNHVRSDFKTGASTKRTLDLDVIDEETSTPIKEKQCGEKSTPLKDAMEVDGTNTNAHHHTKENITARRSGSNTLDTTPIAESPAKRNNNALDITPVVESPLRSPSPLLMSQFMKPSPAVSAQKGGNHNHVRSDFKTGASTKRTLDLDVIDEETSTSIKEEQSTPLKKETSTPSMNEKCTPLKDAMDIDETATNTHHHKQSKENIDFGTTEPVLDNKIIEAQQRKQRILHQMNMKKQAIYRSLLHLSDNSYSFVYDDSNDGQTRNANNDDEKEEEPGLPFIGPGVKEQYEMLRLLLRKGLLGQTAEDPEDDDSNEKKDNTNDNNKTGEESKDDQNEEKMSNPFLPRIQANVSAVLMGPRGHGKTLVLERCLASLSRSASKQKERVLDRMMTENQQQIPGQAEEMYGQASFRVVRLNGLLFQGDSAVACTREIARQIGVMSREERKRTKRMMKQMASARRKRNRIKKLQSSDLETPKCSKKQRRKEKDASNRSVGQTKLVMTPPAATPASVADQSKTTENLTPDRNNESHDLRIRRSGFNTYIALLDEVLRTARVDGIPILIVLEELDSFLAGGRSSNIHNATEDVGGNNPMMPQDAGSSDRQLLLYHLLDRVADHKYLVSLVGMTSDLTTVTKLEKRVQSRAEGTSKIIYFGHDESYGNLAESLLGKFYTPPEATGKVADDDYTEEKAMLDIRDEVEFILRGGKSGEKLLSHEEKDDEINEYTIVHRVLERNYNLMGSDMRWVCRVFDVALGLLASDIDEHMHECMENLPDYKETDLDINPKLSPRHMAQALVTMGASLDDLSGKIGRPGMPTQSEMELIRWGQLLDDPKHYSRLLGTQPRLAALLDLAGPQIAVLLAARRIVARDDTHANAEDEVDAIQRKEASGGGASATVLVPLTYQRIQDEYTTSFVASGKYTISSDRYPPHVLYRSCTDLMELDLIRLKKEQCRGGGLQFGHNDTLSTGTDISHLPIHIILDWNLEFMGALRAGLLQCTTALREWGMKMN